MSKSSPRRRSGAYSYEIKTLADIRKNDTVFVPNSSAEEAIQIWRWLTGLRKDFPAYFDGHADILITDLGDESWCDRGAYREAHCPMDMTCIVRRPKGL